MQKILILGKQGQVAWELQRTLASLGHVTVFGSQDLDLANPDRIREQVRSIQPAIIVNAAAYTAVDKAESEPELCMSINELHLGFWQNWRGSLKLCWYIIRLTMYLMVPRIVPIQKPILPIH